MERYYSHFFARVVLVVFLTVVTNSLLVSPTHAAVISTAKDILSTMKESVVANHTISFTQTGGDTFQSGENITLTFPTGFNLTSLSSPLDFDFKVASTDETIQSGVCGGTDTVRAEIASQVVTFTACSSYTAEAANTAIEIEIGLHATTGGNGAQQIVNQTAAQNASDAKILVGGTEVSGKIAVEIIVNNTVAVTGQVDPSISCAIDDTSAGFSTFTLGSVTTADSTPIWTISTNGQSGYVLTVKSAGNSTNAGLYSAGASYVIKSANTAEDATADLSVAATIGYGAQAAKTNGDSGSAATTISSPYDSVTTTVGRLQLTAQTVASATGPVSNATVTTTLKAKVTGLVPSGSYVDTLTYVCTGIY